MLIACYNGMHAACDYITIETAKQPQISRLVRPYGMMQVCVRGDVVFFQGFYNKMIIGTITIGMHQNLIFTLLFHHPS
jgi:hypothetical protein